MEHESEPGAWGPSQELPPWQSWDPVCPKGCPGRGAAGCQGARREVACAQAAAQQGQLGRDPWSGAPSELPRLEEARRGAGKSSFDSQPQSPNGPLRRTPVPTLLAEPREPGSALSQAAGRRARAHHPGRGVVQRWRPQQRWCGAGAGAWGRHQGGGRAIGAGRSVLRDLGAERGGWAVGCWRERGTGQAGAQCGQGTFSCLAEASPRPQCRGCRLPLGAASRSGLGLFAPEVGREVVQQRRPVCGSPRPCSKSGAQDEELEALGTSGQLGECARAGGGWAQVRLAAGRKQILTPSSHCTGLVQRVCNGPASWGCSQARAASYQSFVCLGAALSCPCTPAGRHGGTVPAAHPCVCAAPAPCPWYELP
ncbi:uncharacterized protein LOC112547988 [Alligator sinensis]|uniref:Uncharacterized protein LOC112547988 n=1 Tax=Alligator sinensis TaxID=38654 RepID=A0A3Q0FJU4_ALLSI|nr:uncharacterized protein LOC112547988 [Alligator sinensis]